VSTHTAADTAGRDRDAVERPTIVLILLSVNDIRRYGPAPGVRMASARESRRNLAALQAMARVAGSSPILTTPTSAATPLRPNPFGRQLISMSSPHSGTVTVIMRREAEPAARSGRGHPHRLLETGVTR
jgi:lysophospholipase L1-like esterase